MLIQLTDVRYYVNFSDRRRSSKKIPENMSFHQLAKLVKMGVEFYNGDDTKRRPLRDKLDYIMFGYKVTDHGKTFHGVESFIPDTHDRDTIMTQFDEWFCDLKQTWQKYSRDEKRLQELENQYTDEFVRKRKRQPQ